MLQTGTNPQASRRSKGRFALVALLLISSLITVGAGAMSLAIFTDTQNSTGSWTAGTITLGVSPSTTFTATGILPGDTGNQTVTVSNTGTGALRYAMSTVTTNLDSKGLATQLALTIDAGSCGATTGNLYTGTLAAAALGSNAVGFQTGDRTVAAGASDLLCFTWTFPQASGNAYKLATTSATFTFDAEQTAHN